VYDDAMLRASFAVLALSACTFDGPAVPGGAPPDGDAPGDASPDAPIDAPPAVLCNATDPMLRACYAFDGDTRDGSMYGHDAVPTGTAFGPGHDGQGLVVGPGDLVTVAGGANLNVARLTIKMWIKPSSIPTGTARAGLVDSGNRFRMFLHSGGLVRCATTSGPSLLTTSAHALQVGQWAHLVCTYDGSTMRIYVGGALAATQNQTSTIPSGTGMVIGQNNPSGENFDGTIDELQIYGAVVAP
jgi:hypothetical protein